MATSAINPTTGILETAHKFVAHGLKQGLCSVCGEMMDIVAEHAPGTSEHFRHERHSLMVRKLNRPFLSFLTINSNKGFSHIVRVIVG
ncbi:hypothetical protein [Yersinia hibernica]|uniref:Uncharacterized protein n=1 Tax=Yersinia enterocolitica LC20 TaxID=1443113 RepID=A0A7U5PH35_YEREN|nr:hypothetical protein [Yersinia hibernica]ATX63052.1 hypothetical protein LC20_09365 [Yersinia hibernica]